jgi:hypothetical protein
MAIAIALVPLRRSERQRPIAIDRVPGAQCRQECAGLWLAVEAIGVDGPQRHRLLRRAALAQATRLKGGLAAVTASVVGVIANLTAWFALHVLFEVVGERRFGPVRFYWPDPASMDWLAGALALIAFLLAFGAKWSVLRILAACGAGGLILGLTI